MNQNLLSRDPYQVQNCPGWFYELCDSLSCLFSFFHSMPIRRIVQGTLQFLLEFHEWFGVVQLLTHISYLMVIFQGDSNALENFRSALRTTSTVHLWYYWYRSLYFLITCQSCNMIVEGVWRCLLVILGESLAHVWIWRSWSTRQHGCRYEWFWLPKWQTARRDRKQIRTWQSRFILLPIVRAMMMTGFALQMWLRRCVAIRVQLWSIRL